MKNKTALIIIVTGLILGAGIILLGSFKKENESPKINSNNISGEEHTIEIKDGIQYITINARGGYSPKVSSAEGGIPTKLIIKTNDTYDCSASLKISSIGYQKILPKTGEEIVDLGIPKSGEPLRGVCGMGMYNFVINFN